MAKRLIDANAYAFPGDLINEPTVDAVEVVGCRDCKHYFHYGKTSLVVDGKNARAGWCQRRTRYDEDIRMLPDDFCSYGERKGGQAPQREDV